MSTELGFSLRCRIFALCHRVYSSKNRQTFFFSSFFNSFIHLSLIAFWSWQNNERKRHGRNCLVHIQMYSITCTVIIANMSHANLWKKEINLIWFVANQMFQRFILVKAKRVSKRLINFSQNFLWINKPSLLQFLMKNWSPFENCSRMKIIDSNAYVRSPFARVI